MSITIEHLPQQGLFQATVEGHRGVCEYHVTGAVMHVTHTEVAPELAGRGVAGALVQAALAHAKAAGLKVNPLCSYVRSYMQRNPETLALQV